MKSRRWLHLLLLVGFLHFSAGTAYAQTGADGEGEKNVKLAQTGFQFLSIGTDARAGALADAMTTVLTGAGSMFFNPAGMANLASRMDLLVSRNTWMADITYNSVAFALSPANERFGVFGFSVMNVNYGEIQGTMVWPNKQGYIDTKVFTPMALAIGIGYARAISDRFSVGGHMKYVNQYLGENIIPVGDDTTTVRKNLAGAVAFDFGTIYQTGFKSLAFGMSVRNFSNEIEFETEGFQLPLTFRIGISMDLMDMVSESHAGQNLLVSIDALHPRSKEEQMNVGVEYRFLNVLSVRGGYMLNYDIQSYSVGFGINLALLAIDYAYTPTVNLGDVHRYSIRFVL